MGGCHCVFFLLVIKLVDIFVGVDVFLQVEEQRHLCMQYELMIYYFCRVLKLWF